MELKSNQIRMQSYRYFLKLSKLFQVALGIIMFLGISCSSEHKSDDGSLDLPMLRAPNQIIDFAGLTPENIQEAADRAIEQAKIDLAAINAQSENTFENTLLAYDKIFNSISRQILPLDLIIEVDPRAEVREASKKA